MVICIFLATFALVIELERHIEILLLSNDCVIVPDFGGFMAHHVDARYDGRDNMFLPPLRTIGFNPQLKMNDSLLAQSYIEAYDISYPEALDRLAHEVAEIRQCLENTGKYELNNIGTLYLNEDGNYSFEPCEAGILTPDYYGFGGFDMLPLSAMPTSATVSVETTNSVMAESDKAEKTEAKEENAQVLPLSTTVFDEEEEESENTEFIQIKKSVLRNMVAACIAIIAFFALSTPLKSPNTQMGKIDTSMLTRLMPKEITNGKKAETLVLDKQLQAAGAQKIADKKDDAVDDQEEIKSATPYYSIVLASRVTKRNAAAYVDRLQAKGLKDAKVQITATNVKVIYGSYETEAQAYNALHQLRNNEIFADSWITKVKE